MDNPALIVAFHLLKFRSRSCQELNNRLKQKGFTQTEINESLDYLIELEYIDDEGFTRLFVKEKIKQKGAGPIYLKTELLKHNIPEDQIDKAIERGYSKFPLDELIKNHIKKRIKILDHENSSVQKRKIIQFLQRKGFTWEQIHPHVNKNFPG